MAKRLVVCLDGTWNSPDNGYPTNVAKIMLAIAPVDEQGTPRSLSTTPGSAPMAAGSIASWMA
jgi:hypothetical protein